MFWRQTDSNFRVEYFRQGEQGSVAAATPMVQDDLWAFVAMGCVAFYFMRSAQTEVLIGLVVVTLWAWIALGHLSEKAKAAETSALAQFSFKKAIQERAAKNGGANAVMSDVFEVGRIPRQGLKYVGGNRELVDIINDLDFVNIFDKARYQDMIIHMDKLQKVYAYVLSQRTPVRMGVPVFVDLRDAVLEILYSMYLVVPTKLRHTYGIQPYDTLRNNVRRFHALSDRMLTILRNFSRDGLKAPHFPHASNVANFDPSARSGALP